MTIVIRNEQEVQAFVAGEKTAAFYMNLEYEFLGYRVLSRNMSKKYDVTLDRGEGVKKIEEKFRNGNHGDVLVEFMQCMAANTPGWFYTAEPDFLFYVICSPEWVPEKYYIFPWQAFKAFVIDYLRKTPRPATIISTKGIGISLNIAVSLNHLPREWRSARTVSFF